jgi:hypothetical protein
MGEVPEKLRQSNAPTFSPVDWIPLGEVSCSEKFLKWFPKEKVRPNELHFLCC